MAREEPIVKQQLWAAAAGMIVGLGLASGLGSGQAERPDEPRLAGDQPEAPQLPAHPTERELALIRGGLFREGSTLLLDPGQSIEQMLVDQARAIARLEGRLAAAPPAGAGALERRVADLELAVGEAGVPELGGLAGEVRDLERTVAALERRVGEAPGSDLAQLGWKVRELERRLDLGGARAESTAGRELRALQASVRRLEDRVRALERGEP